MGKIVYKYTKEDLKRNRKAYQENFEKLMKSVGTKEHTKYAREENRLENECVDIQRDLGVYVEDPCMFRLSIRCEDCTPAYRDGEKKCEFFERFKNLMLKGGVL